MTLGVRTAIISTDWTLVTNKIAAIQFNDEMEVVITGSSTPPLSTDLGFIMKAGSDCTNGCNNLYVWAKARVGGSGVESVRILEDLA